MNARRQMYRFICFGALTAVATAGYSQQQWDKGQTFIEAPDPVKVNEAAWHSVKSGLHASFASLDKRYAKSEVPAVKTSSSIKLKGWKGERISAQIVLWTGDSIPNVKVQVGDFVSKNGQQLGPIGYARFERYVMTDEYGPGCGYRKNGDFPASLSPDMLDDLSSFSLEKNKTRPVWITIDIPANADKGTYSAKVAITSDKGKKQELSIALEVIDLVLPPASDWKFHLDQWQHPSAVARVNNLPMWSDEHFEAMKPQMKMLADAGQKVITATLNKDPWHVQTLDPYADMIIWTKEANGAWSYDYRVFDRWISFMMDLGIRQMIDCYSIVPWNNEIHYKDAKTGRFIDVVAKPGTETFRVMWEPFLKDFAKHLKEKGWLDITNIALDERNKDEMGAAFDLIAKVAPELGVAYADNQQTYKRYTNSDNVSTAVQHPIDPKDLAERRAKGLNTTFYVYCGNRFPNQFTFSAPAESAYMGWYAEAAGYDGVLRWAFNSWVENPLVESRFRTWPAGDTYIVYPQARSSIRYERMIEGIQDYEKIQIVKKKLEEKNDTTRLKALQTAIAKLSDIKNTRWNEELNAAKALLDEASASLTK
ncbi:glycoside hydrolase domain-containing protein [Chitinophaga sp. NPDC101104]|uniref:DUF4091 domain-containing protein n=1 Tax=Chitinophaga sp. NPDC101104 TaxID=3390561 RepID=UPI003CFFD928